jgi:hypothetical protein
MAVDITCLYLEKRVFVIYCVSYDVVFKEEIGSV